MFPLEVVVGCGEGVWFYSIWLLIPYYVSLKKKIPQKICVVKENLENHKKIQIIKKA